MDLSRTAALAYDILEGGGTNWQTTVFQVFIVSLISVNVLLVILESEHSISATYGDFLELFEAVSLYIFVGEYAARLFANRFHLRHSGKRFALLRVVVSPMMLIDLAVILPYVLPLVAADTRILRIMRLLRLFSVLKLLRLSESMRTFGSVIRAKAADMFIAFFILLVVLIMASGLMFYAEREAQPQMFSSIPASMWWGIVTITTIGYGDVYPVTVAGKIIAAAVALLGIAVYAIPTAIIVSAFRELRRKNTKGGFCPHCGEALE